MVISARFNSLTECCTWWVNSPGSYPFLSALICHQKLRPMPVKPIGTQTIERIVSLGSAATSKRQMLTVTPIPKIRRQERTNSAMSAISSMSANKLVPFVPPNA